MKKDNVVDLQSIVPNLDPLSDFIRRGVKTLLQKAIEAELRKQMAKFEGRKLDDSRAAQRLSSRARDPDWDRACRHADPQGAGKGW